MRQTIHDLARRRAGGPPRFGAGATLHYGDLTDSTPLSELVAAVRPDELYG